MGTVPSRTVCCLTRPEEGGSKEQAQEYNNKRKRGQWGERPGSRDWVRSGRQVQEAAHMYARMCVRMYVSVYVPAQPGERQQGRDGDGKKEIDS